MSASEEKYCHEKPLRSLLVNCSTCDQIRKIREGRFRTDDLLNYLTFSDKQMLSSELTLCNWYKSFQSNQKSNHHVDGNDTVNCNFIVTLIGGTVSTTVMI